MLLSRLSWAPYCRSPSPLSRTAALAAGLATQHGPPAHAASLGTHRFSSPARTWGVTRLLQVNCRDACPTLCLSQAGRHLYTGPIWPGSARRRRRLWCAVSATWPRAALRHQPEPGTAEPITYNRRLLETTASVGGDEGGGGGGLSPEAVLFRDEGLGGQRAGIGERSEDGTLAAELGQEPDLVRSDEAWRPLSAPPER